MKILLLGASGQVGWELQRSLASLAQLDIHDRSTADLEDLNNLKSLIQGYMPDVIVNAAAYTAVDLAEQDCERAYLINAVATSVIAEEAKKINACFIHYSTDYVFDGSKDGKYTELDQPNPLSVYGKSKHEGERAIIDSKCNHFILRTSWVYALRGNNFVKTMIKLAREKDELNVVVDQIGAPTSAELIADVSALIIFQMKNDSNFCQNHSGIYNLVANGETSWHGFASHVINYAEKLGVQFRLGAESIKPILTKQFPRPAPRPHNSLMNPGKLERLLGINLPDWKFHVERMVKEITESSF